MKYKYSRKEMLKKLGCVFHKGFIEYPTKVDGLILTDLLAKQPKQKSIEDTTFGSCKHKFDTHTGLCVWCGTKQPKQKLIGEKTSSKILDSGTHQPISKPKSKVNPKTCNHQWKQQGEGPNCYCEKCHSLLVKKGNRPTLQPIEKIPIRIKEQTETTILVNQWDLAHKVNQIIDRINLLSEGREI